MFCVAARFAAAQQTCKRRASSYPQTELFELHLVAAAFRCPAYLVLTQSTQQFHFKR
jgi:hypothetical protein